MKAPQRISDKDKDALVKSAIQFAVALGDDPDEVFHAWFTLMGNIDTRDLKDMQARLARRKREIGLWRESSVGAHA